MNQVSPRCIDFNKSLKTMITYIDLLAFAIKFATPSSLLNAPKACCDVRKKSNRVEVGGSSFD